MLQSQHTLRTLTSTRTIGPRETHRSPRRSRHRAGHRRQPGRALAARRLGGLSLQPLWLPRPLANVLLALDSRTYGTTVTVTVPVPELPAHRHSADQRTSPGTS